MFFTAIPKLAAIYAKWTFLRAVLHRGWWLVTSLYLVVVADLSPLQLVLLGTGQGLTVIAMEIPTGVFADTISRKLSIIVAHLLAGAAMMATGLVQDFHALMLTQMIWGLSWTFSTGADVAWLTDEVQTPDDIGRLLAVAARWGQLGSAVGLLLFGLYAWLCGLAVAMVTAGALMWVLGLYVWWQFPETHFVPSAKRSWRGIQRTIGQGIAATRASRAIVLVLVVTFLVNGADEAFNRLYAKQLFTLNLPQLLDPILWFTLLGLVGLASGALVLRLSQAQFNRAEGLQRLYIVGCGLGAFGLMLFALAPDYRLAMLAVVLVHGVAWNLVRVVAVVSVNNQAPSQVRATLQSFLSQAENLGEVSLGLALGVLAGIIGIPFALFCAGLAVVLAAGLLLWERHNKVPEGLP